MKKLLILLILSSCSEITTSIYRCDNKVALEKDACIESYENYDRHQRYLNFRGHGFVREYPSN